MNGERADFYKEKFLKAYGAAPYTIAHVANALAEFQRQRFWAGKTPWDQYLKGDKNALTPIQKKGAVVFFDKGQCATCHKGMHLSAFDFDAVAVPQLSPQPSPGSDLTQDDLGRFEVTGDTQDQYRFRVSPLRNLSMTAPYMHNGVFSNLWQVIDHYDKPLQTLAEFVWSGLNQPYHQPLVLDKNPLRQSNRVLAIATDLVLDLNLSQNEKVELWCFLQGALTDAVFQQQILNQIEYQQFCM
jgi:cytochrome c peroxidase